VKNKRSRPVYRKELSDLAAEWDAIVDVRHRQILEGVDVSYNLILKPTVLELLEDRSSLARLIDVGCGSGDLSASLAQHCGQLVGVDVSPHSVEVAASVCRHLPNTSFYAASVERFASGSAQRDFSVAVANMTLMTAPDLYQAIAGVAKVLSAGGTFVVTIAHPCFWPQYWGYDGADWFRYDREIGIEAPFRISHEETSCLTTHFHRPLSQYAGTLSQLGFVVDRLVEPMPDAEVEARYPERWRFPRFLGLRCRLQATPRSAAGE
jgi:SAM-dependent methyltransferase